MRDQPLLRIVGVAHVPALPVGGIDQHVDVPDAIASPRQVVRFFVGLHSSALQELLGVRRSHQREPCSPFLKKMLPRLL